MRTRGTYVNPLSSLRKNFLAAFLSRRRCTKMSSTLPSWSLPKRRGRPRRSAPEPCMKVYFHTAPQQRGVCPTYLYREGLSPFSDRDSGGGAVADCPFYRSRRKPAGGHDRLPCGL